MKFDPTKPVKTKEGNPARILCTNNQDDMLVVEVTDLAYSDINLFKYHKNGKVHEKEDSPWDLENIRFGSEYSEKVWLNVYRIGGRFCGTFAETKYPAEPTSGKELFARVLVNIEFSDGEGL